MSNIKDLDQLINDELTVYAKDITEEVKQATIKASKTLVKLTKQTAPVGNRTTHHFKQDIACKTTNENEFELTRTWYVKAPSYRLTHLLENGHAKRNGGRVPGTHFIAKACDKVIPVYEKEIEDIINGK